MVTKLLPHEIIYIVIFFCAAAVFWLAWPKRKIPGGLFFLFHLIALDIWVLGLFFEAGSINFLTKILWSQIFYCGFVSVVPFLLLFVLAYTSQTRVNLPIIIGVFLVPFFILIAAWTNQWHHLLWSNFYWGDPTYNILVYEHGFLFYIHVVYLYVLTFFGAATLLLAIPKNKPPFRSQLIVILIGVLFPIISGTMYIFNLDPIKGMDISAFGFLFTNLFMVYGFMRYQLLDLVPVARGVLIQRIQDGMIVLDWQMRIVEINQNAINLFDLTPDHFIGQPLKAVIPFNIDLPSLSLLNSPSTYCINQTQPKYVDLQVSSLSPQSKSPPGYLLVFRDVTEQKITEVDLKKANEKLRLQINKVNRLQTQLKEQATHDSLTGLFNRRLMDEVLDEKLSSAKHLGLPFSIAVMDIDYFKKINDIYGHQIGDHLLREYGQSILDSIRQEDFACRFGGDEILLAFLGMSTEIALRKANEIREKLHLIEINENLARISTTTSIGVATFPTHGTTVAQLINAADQALYTAKEQGRNNVLLAASPQEKKSEQNGKEN